jgi:hypothetical protein
MMKKLLTPVLMLAGCVLPGGASAGIFAPAAGQPGSTAISDTDPGIESWATGYQDYLPGTEVDAGFKTPAKAIGVAGNSNGANEGFVYDIVSLGRGGSITMKFNPPIKNASGYDFAIFENGYSDTFLELGKVEVSTNGTDFVAFPAFSQVPAPVGGFGTVDTTDVEQVAGKYRAGYGTPFDLEQLATSPVLDLNRIRYVRITDVVGDGTAANDLSVPTLANWLGITVGEMPPVLIDAVNAAPPVIYDPYPTFGSAGFDLDAVAVLNAGPRQVELDIAVFDASNEVDPADIGELSIGVLTTSLTAGDDVEFNPAQINSATLKFGAGNAMPVSGPFTVNVDGDADNDRVFSFSIQDVGVLCGDTGITLSGQTNAGEFFWGWDTITTVNCDSGCHP